MDVWVVIPAYNEGETLKTLLPQIKEKKINILVVDDGSEDDTFLVSSSFADKVLRNENNFGKGFALKKGIDYLLKNHSFDYLITMDADGQHSPSDIDKFIHQAENKTYFVVGNRMPYSKTMPKLRFFTNKLMSAIISFILKQKIPDTQCGFRFIKREVLEKINIETENFEIDSEIIIKAAKAGYPIKSIPVKCIYNSELKSKINPFADTLRFIKFIIKFIR